MKKIPGFTPNRYVTFRFRDGILNRALDLVTISVDDIINETEWAVTLLVVDQNGERRLVDVPPSNVTSMEYHGTWSDAEASQ